MRIKIKNGKSVLIREARSSDASRILEYIDRISCESDFLTFGQGEFEMSIEQEEQFLDSIARQNNALFIIAEIDSKIIGTASFSGGARPRISHIGELSVSVLKEYWGNGIGTELVKYIIDWCKNSGIIKKINLIVRNDNFSAIHVYKKLGFTEEGVITREFQIKSEFYSALFMGYIID